MAIRYQISTWNSSTATEAREYRVCKRIDAALRELWSQCYSMLEGDGALDTERAHRLLRENEAFEVECKAGKILPRGNHYFSRNFVLRHDMAGALTHVKFTAIRDDR